MAIPGQRKALQRIVNGLLDGDRFLPEVDVVAPALEKVNALVLAADWLKGCSKFKCTDSGGSKERREGEVGAW